jgi:hypothetical protein
VKILSFLKNYVIINKIKKNFIEFRLFFVIYLLIFLINFSKDFYIIIYFEKISGIEASIQYLSEEEYE